MSQPRTLPTRRILPTRRLAATIDFELFDGYACQGYSGCYAEFDDGTLAEVFLRPVGGPAAKVGMPLDTMAKDLSVLLSIALRYGAPVDVIRAALSQEKSGKMLGPLGEFLRRHAAEMPILPVPPVPDFTPLGSAACAQQGGHGDDEDGGVRADPHAAVASPHAGAIRILGQEPRVSRCGAAFKRALRWFVGILRVDSAL